MADNGDPKPVLAYEPAEPDRKKLPWVTLAIVAGALLLGSVLVLG